MTALGKAIGADLWLEFVVPSVDNFEQDLQRLGRALIELGNPFTAVMISPAPDLKCTSARESLASLPTVGRLLPGGACGSSGGPTWWRDVQLLYRVEPKATTR